MTSWRTRTLLACCLAGWLFAGPAHSQEYPSRPVRIVVPWPPGGIADIAARLVGERIQASLGQTFVIENKLGAGGSIGAEQVARAAPDGHTLLLTTSALNMSHALRSKLTFDATKDFEPIAAVASAPAILVVHTGLGVKSVKELIALAKSRPGKLTYASAGPGSPAHLAAELFKSTVNIDLIHVPYKGAPQAVLDQIAGRVDVQIANPTVAVPQVRAGKLIALAVTSQKRLPSLPEIPTMAEAGVPTFEADQWLGLFAPRGAPSPIVQRLSAELSKALANEEVRATLAQNGMTASAGSAPAEFSTYLKQDLAKWVAVVKASNIQAE